MHVALEALALGARNTGIGVCIANLLTGLAQIESTDLFTIYTSDFEGAHDVVRPAAADLVTVPCSAESRLVRAAWRQFCLNRRVRRDGADLLHGTAYVLPIATPDPPVPTVVTVHDLIALTHPQFCPTLNAWHFRSLLPRTLRRARRIIVHSRATADELIGRSGVPARKISVLRPGIADVFFKRLTKAKRESVALRYNLPERYLLFAGNLEPKKNLRTVLAALERASEHGYTGSLVLTAPQCWKNHPLAAKLTAPGSRIRVTGYVRPDDMPALYANADALVFVSLVEGFGLPIVEAQATGRPVVTSNILSMPEVAGGAACLVDPFDVASIREGLLRIIGDSSYRDALVRRGHENVKRFHPASIAAEYVKLYEELAAA